MSRHPAWELARSSSSFASRVSLNNIYAVPRHIKPGILNLTIRRNQSNLALSLFLLAQRKRLLSQRLRSKFSSEGLKKNSWTKFGLLHAWESLFDFPKMTENAFTTIQLLTFFHIFSDVCYRVSKFAITRNWIIHSK